jgi:hypothetical protein
MEKEALKIASREIAKKYTKVEHLKMVGEDKFEITKKKNALEVILSQSLICSRNWVLWSKLSWRKPGRRNLSSRIQSDLWEGLGASELDNIFLTGSFKQIDELCLDCQQLIQNYNVIRTVNISRSNLLVTLKELDRLLQVPEQVHLSLSKFWKFPFATQK